MPDAPLPPLPPVGQPRWRTAADELLRRLPAPPATWAVAAALAACAAVVVLGLVAMRPGLGGPPALPAAAPAAPEPASTPGGSARSAEPAGSGGKAEPAGSGGKAEPAGSGGQAETDHEVVVDVSGAVTRPGLVRLRRGARVADAVVAAGGPAPGADPSLLNQARVLGDGEQVRVPRVGEPAPIPLPAATGPARTGAGAPTVPVDLNHATVDELDVLPGVGPATAAAIVSWREENGGFRRVDDLLEVPGIGPARLERLRPHVRV